MAVHGGKFGVVNGVSTVRNWSITDSMSAKEFVASNTRFGTGRENGVQEWSGSYNTYGHTPPAMPGNSFSFAGYTAPDDDSSGAGLKYTGTALVESVAINWNWGSGEIIQSTVNFKGHLALASASATVTADETEPTIFSCIGTKIQFSSDLDAWTDWTNLMTAQLTITNKLQSYVNSDTVVSGNLWTGQKTGPMDWTLAVTEQDTVRDRFLKGATLGLRLFVNDAQFWELVWGKVIEFTGLNVDIESGAILQQTVNFGMKGFVSGGDPAVGRVLVPGGSLYWGEPAA